MEGTDSNVRNSLGIMDQQDVILFLPNFFRKLSF